MKKQSAMSCASLWDCKLGQDSDSELEKFSLFKDEIEREEVNDPLLKLFIETNAHDIGDHVKKENDDWLDDFPFGEIESLISLEGFADPVEKPKDFGVKLGVDQAAPLENLFAAELQSYASELLPSSYENSTTFVVPDENILFVNAQPFFHVPLECWSQGEEPGEPEDGKSPEPPEETAVGEEILKITASELNRWDTDASSSSVASESSPERREEETSDPDWSPEPERSAGSRKRHGRRAKPYWKERTQEDRILKKKEQNKNAATRYRQKKKAEASGILKEEAELLDNNAKLKARVSDIENEVRCLKRLMRDLFKAKGLIN